MVKTNINKQTNIIDVGGRKARVGIGVADVIKNLIPAFFSLAIASMGMQIALQALSHSGIGKGGGNKSQVH